MSKTVQLYQSEVMEKTQCVHCGSLLVDFIDYGRVNRRLNDKNVSVTEQWVCLKCGREFERLGTLYSPNDLRAIRLRTAILTWSGYTVGSFLAYAIYFGSIV